MFAYIHLKQTHAWLKVHSVKNLSQTKEKMEKHYFSSNIPTFNFDFTDKNEFLCIRLEQFRNICKMCKSDPLRAMLGL